MGKAQRIPPVEDVDTLDQERLRDFLKALGELSVVHGLVIGGLRPGETLVVDRRTQEADHRAFYHTFVAFDGYGVTRAGDDVIHGVAIQPVFRAAVRAARAPEAPAPVRCETCRGAGYLLGLERNRECRACGGTGKVAP